MAWYDPRTWVPEGLTWFADRTEEGAEGGLARGAGAENLTGSLSSIGNGFNLASTFMNAIAGFLWIIGARDLAESIINNSESLAARGSLVDENALDDQTQMEQGNFDIPENTLPGEEPQPPSNRFVPEQDTDLSVPAGAVGGYALGRTAAFGIGTTSSVFDRLRNRAARLFPQISAATPNGPLSGADRLLGSTRLGRLATIGVTGLGVGTAAFASTAEASISPEMIADTPASHTLVVPNEYTPENADVLPEIAVEFDAARATSVGLDGLYRGLIDGVSSVGYAVDGVNWALGGVGLDSDQPFLGRDHIHSTLTQAYNGYADNVAPALNQQPQNAGERIAGLSGEITGQLVGAFGLAKGLQAAGSVATTSQVFTAKEGIDITRAMTPAMP